MTLAASIWAMLEHYVAVHTGFTLLRTEGWMLADDRPLSHLLGVVVPGTALPHVLALMATVMRWFLLV